MEKNRRKIALFGFGGIICLFLVIGVSYAIWQLVLQQTNENVVTTGCFKINFRDQNDINLNNAYPIEDEAGRKLTPYEFTLENTCDTPASYQVNLEILDTTTLENLEYIKVMFDESAPRILTKYNEVQKTLDNATTSYKLDLGFLEGNTSKTFTLRLWMDEDTPPVEEAMNKIFKSKVTITTVYEEKLPGTLRSISYYDTTGMWEYKANITKLVIQDKLEEIPNAIAVNDESSLQDKSIMSYVIPNEDGKTYEAYLQGNKLINLNPNSFALFANFSQLATIEGMEYLDSSNVSNMDNMFSGCSSLTSLDVNHFDTTNVINMHAMFQSCRSLTNLDVSYFDTTNVTIMSNMFYDCRSLTNLDIGNFNTENVTDMSSMFNSCNSLIGLALSNFDTRNVTNMNAMFYFCGKLEWVDISDFDTLNVTIMSNMFYGCNSLTNLDVSHFDTRNVTNMNSMFNSCNSLTGLDVSNFNTINVTNMSHMFNKCSGLTDLDVSHFDTTNVTNMGAMFSGCGSLTSLNLSSFDTTNVTNMGAMFFGCGSLTSLNLSSFDTTNVTNYGNDSYGSGMFQNCINLITITYGENFICEEGATTTNMFLNCPANKPTHESWNGVTF